jgi:hypothetical protein
VRLRLQIISSTFVASDPCPYPGLLISAGRVRVRIRVRIRVRVLTLVCVRIRIGIDVRQYWTDSYVLPEARSKRYA